MRQGTKDQQYFFHRLVIEPAEFARVTNRTLRSSVGALQYP